MLDLIGRIFLKESKALFVMKFAAFSTGIHFEIPNLLGSWIIAVFSLLHSAVLGFPFIFIFQGFEINEVIKFDFEVLLRANLEVVLYADPE